MTSTIATPCVRRAPALPALAVIVAAVLAGVGPVIVLGLRSPSSVFDSYILGVARFTLLQAALSTLLSLALGIPVARALARRRFPGRGLMVRLLSVPLALPAIVAVLGIVEIFGAHGLLGGLVNLYGLTGILIAHVFFNFPMAARMGLSALEAVPPESHRLAAELGFSDRDMWRHVDRPALLAAMPGAAVLIFLLCAASFTIVLTLGGGPRATTLEVAIYQALRFDFDPSRATLLSLVQVAICAVLVAVSQRFPASFAALPPLRRTSFRSDGTSALSRAIDGFALATALLLLLPPLIAVMAAGLSGLAPTPALFAAIATSIAIGCGAALLSFALCWPLAGLAARSGIGRRLAGGAVLAGLILPPAVMATGWFILLSRFTDVLGLAPALVLALNGLMALPFNYTILAPAVAQAAAQNDRLCESLGLSGTARFRLIDFPVLRRPIGLALVMAAIVSLGDLTAITLFGAQGFATLPALLYQQMGSYRMEGAAGTALVLALLALALVALAERWSRAGD
jgi:thiamine transport system permease protein